MGVFYDVRVHLADFPEDMDLRAPVIRKYMISSLSLIVAEKLQFFADLFRNFQCLLNSFESKEQLF